MKYIVATIVLFICTLGANAQQDPSYTFYKYNMNLINPAYAGAHQGFELGLGLRSQWANVKGAPETQTAFFGMPLGKNVGVGASILNDKTFIESQTSVSLDFSYKLMLNDDWDLFLGIKAGFNSYDINTKGLITYGMNADPNLMNLSGRLIPNVGAGAYLRGKGFFASLSVPKLFSSDRLERDQTEVKLGSEKLHVYGTAGYDFDLGNNLVLKPSVMVRYISTAPTNVDLTLALAPGDRFEVGGAYRFEERFSGFVIFKVNSDIAFGYSYESALEKAISKAANGSHELFLKLAL